MKMVDKIIGVTVAIAVLPYFYLFVLPDALDEGAKKLNYGRNKLLCYAEDIRLFMVVLLVLIIWAIIMIFF